jgi:hypothetical protein
MSVYRFRVFFEDQPEVSRIIDILEDQTFEDFHKVILKSIDFREGEFASFYIDYQNADDTVEICLSDLQSENDETVLLMSDIKIRELIQGNIDSITYIYDFIELWTLKIEVMNSKGDKVAKLKYPAIIEKTGKAPEQNDSNLLIATDFTNEDQLLLERLKNNNEALFHARQLEKELEEIDDFDEVDYDDDED